MAAIDPAIARRPPTRLVRATVVVAASVMLVAGLAAAAIAQTAPASRSADLPPEPVPLTQWTPRAWIGVVLYLVVFVLVARWIYRLAAIEDER